MDLAKKSGPRTRQRLWYSDMPECICLPASVPALYRHYSRSLLLGRAPWSESGGRLFNSRCYRAKPTGLPRGFRHKRRAGLSFRNRRAGCFATSASPALSSHSGRSSRAVSKASIHGRHVRRTFRPVCRSSPAASLIAPSNTGAMDRRRRIKRPPIAHISRLPPAARRSYRPGTGPPYCSLIASRSAPAATKMLECGGAIPRGGQILSGG